MAIISDPLSDQMHSAVYTSWDGRDQAGKAAANGVYLYRLEAGEFGQTRTMTLVR
jgi:hypothetical protein